MIINQPWIKLKKLLSHEDYTLIHALEILCSKDEQITLKLELDHKLSDADNNIDKSLTSDINEFMYFDADKLIGYIGICSFGDESGPLEITGMVHPEYRRQGIFSKLFELVAAECRRRKVRSFLVLCDRKSISGQKFLAKAGALLTVSEFEMYLQDEKIEQGENKLLDVNLRKASNADALEITRQDAIYFSHRTHQENEEVPKPGIVLPEDWEKRGLTVYLAEKDEKVIGKVNLQLIKGVGGIYGLGVLPENRGKGFGRVILLNAIQKLKQAEATTIMLQVVAENTTALNLYRSCGFRETSVMDYFELNCVKE